jgi:ubiquitin C-terminal hydrolase
MAGVYEMDAYDDSLAPCAFGLNNTGVICYFNAFLQLLAGCTAFTRGVLQNAAFLRRTATGAAVAEFVTAYTARPPAPGIEQLSARVLHALVSDLAVRRPHTRFGGGQESASEALVHLLDMMEPPRPGAPTAVESAMSPITGLFLHRFRCDVHCRACKKVVSKTEDYAVNFNLFHLDRLVTPPATVAEFSKAVRLQASAVEDYCCPSCAQPAASACRLYSLTMVPEIVVCMFNLYVGFGGVRSPRYFPERLEFPANGGGGVLTYRLVGQVEHAGALSGGHYWARGLRAGGQTYLLNDTGVSPAEFAPTAQTYIVAYHYAGTQALA